ncbi:hypothetical protein F66182_8288 [Fusarium sp. NRRL 66182]|nr:hypothetical protein F66182_8288 [Fusarium sp. NRRL 66182]
MSSRRRNDLYSWSITVASFGVLPYAVGWLVYYLDVVSNVVDIFINDIGWMLLTTGQALVPYSRLHLLIKGEVTLGFVKWMIVVNAVVWHTVMTVLLFVTRPQGRLDHDSAFVKVKKTSLTCFYAQNLILSGLYLWKTTEIIRKKTAEDETRRVIWQLLVTNVLIVVIDIALLALGLTNNSLWQQGLKALFYSVKLKLEFVILGKLGDFVHNGGEVINESDSTPMFRFVEMQPESQPQTSERASSMAAPEALYLEDMWKRLRDPSAAESSRNRASLSGGIIDRKGKGVERLASDENKNKNVCEPSGCSLLAST